MIAVGMGHTCRNKKPLAGMGSIFFSLNGNRTLAIGDEVKFVLLKGVGIDLPGKICGAEKLSTGVTYGIQIRKIYLLQAFQVITPLILTSLC